MRTMGWLFIYPQTARDVSTDPDTQKEHVLFLSCLSLRRTCEQAGMCARFRPWALIINNAFQRWMHACAHTQRKTFAAVSVVWLSLDQHFMCFDHILWENSNIYSWRSGAYGRNKSESSISLLHFEMSAFFRKCRCRVGTTWNSVPSRNS